MVIQRTKNMRAMLYPKYTVTYPIGSPYGEPRPGKSKSPKKSQSPVKSQVISQLIKQKRPQNSITLKSAEKKPAQDDELLPSMAEIQAKLLSVDTVE